MTKRVACPTRSFYEDGQVTVLMATIVSLCCFLFVLNGAVVVVFVAKSQAQTAADMAAVAAAHAHLGFIDDDPCVLAADIARAHNAQLTSCHAQGKDMTIGVHKTVSALAHMWSVQASARAGPSSR